MRSILGIKDNIILFLVYFFLFFFFAKLLDWISKRTLNFNPIKLDNSFRNIYNYVDNTNRGYMGVALYASSILVCKCSWSLILFPIYIQIFLWVFNVHKGWVEMQNTQWDISFNTVEEQNRPWIYFTLFHIWDFLS